MKRWQRRLLHRLEVGHLKGDDPAFVAKVVALAGRNLELHTGKLAPAKEGPDVA